MTPTIEFSHIVAIDPWPAAGIAVDLEATVAECRGLKERFDLIDLPSLKASGKIEKDGEGLVFDGTLRADVVQICVVTLKPVPSVVKAFFERRYRQGDDAASDGGQGEAALDGDDADIDVLDRDFIDIGEVIAEEFCLALDPYPRAQDADVALADVQGTLDQDGSALPDGPFAKLRRH